MAVIGALERGDKVTRVEAFVDAAFAFALTLLVIAGDHIPASVDELLGALKSLPAYALGFLLMLRFWTAHVAWSRRYGLDDASTRRLSLLLVFLVLVFVYPMKMVMGTLCAALSLGWLPAEFVLSRYEDISILFVVFGVAFGSLGSVMALLYAHAWRQREAIGLDACERIETRARLLIWSLVPLVALLSICTALAIPARRESGWWLGLPGFLYFSLNIAGPLIERHSQRMQARLHGAAA